MGKRPEPMKTAAKTRGGDPRTSREAADMVTVKLGSIRHRVLAALIKYGPCTDERLCKALPDLGESTVRGRRSELVDGYFVQATKQRAVTKRGNRTIVWEATKHGRQMLSEISDENPSPTPPAPASESLFGHLVERDRAEQRML